ncbi:hypothetical protein MRB53_015211 [Persea americana]|uniref:Uncharacterized protein n=1 Tax=Persea americana TaxID=3435 RepID=A0ACC2KD25_PERAE|nr:hypothetical protein MRB53_015211 [Persea americana]
MGKQEEGQGLMNCLGDLKWAKLAVGEGEPMGVLEVGWAMVGGNGGEAGLDDGWGEEGRDEIARLKVGWEEGGNGVVAEIAEGGGGGGGWLL